ncbi:MAG: PqqD family protein [Proteobacteria bacterium]|nr:PqqD family protein [Desulfobulbaceae bacterium]MBU4154116.1 PqqD family protein [Pseudomonadota bacterium]
MRNDDSLSSCFRDNGSYVSRRIGDEIILVPIRQHGAELHSIVRLNDVAAFIWEKLDGKSPTNALTTAIIECYQVDEEQAAADLDTLLRQLLEINAIEAA